jgi:hypothetical protein
MTMSLARGLSTLNTKKRKPKKYTLKQQAQHEIDCRAYNKRMRQIGAHDQQMSLEDYALYLRGQYKPKVTKTKTLSKNWAVTSYTRETTNREKYPSAGNGIGNCTKKENMQYTGTLIKGIATMHKSNAVPIMNKEQAIDIANMRRN